MPDNMPYQDTYIDKVKTTIPVTAVTIVTTDMHLQSPPAISGSYKPDIFKSLPDTAITYKSACIDYLDRHQGQASRIY